MEYLLLALLLLGIVLSGSVAFVWCSLLSSRISELETAKKTLEERLRRLQSGMQKQLHRESIQEDFRAATRKNIDPSTPELPRENEVKKINTPLPNPAVRPPEAYQQVIKPIQKEGLTLPQKIDSLAATQLETPSQTPPELPGLKSIPDLPSFEEFKPITNVSQTENLESPHSSPLIKEPETQESPLRPLGDRQWEKANSNAASRDTAFSWQSLEILIGRKIFGWIAVIGFILSATFFIRYAVQEGWIKAIPPMFKILGIAAVGGAFLIVGKYFSNKNWRRFSTMLSSAGMIIIFQAGYASHAFYQLISLTSAGVLMSIIVIGCFLLAWHYQSRLLGIISILGGLAVPMLLSSGTDQHPQFFSYLVILNLGTIMLVGLLGRVPIAWLAFFGTQVEFWLWYNQYYAYPEKLTAVLFFQAAFYGVYLIDTTVASLIPWGKMDWTRTSNLVRRLTIREQLEQSDEIRSTPMKPTWDDAIRAIISPILFFGTFWFLIRNDEVLGDWLGIFAFIGAAWYALLATIYGRQIKRLWSLDAEKNLSIYWKAGPTAATVISLGFVAIGIPLEFSAHWIALGWIAVFSGLWYFGHRQENKTFVILSCIFAGLGFVRLLGGIFWEKTHLVGMIPFPVLNADALPSLAASLLIILVAVLTDRVFKTRGTKIWKNVEIRAVNFGFGLVGYGFLTAVLSVESYQYFKLHPSFYFIFQPAHAKTSADWPWLSLTILWSFLAWLLLEAGIRFRSINLRYTALTALFIVSIKILFDFIRRFDITEPLANPYCPGLIVSSLLFIFLTVRITAYPLADKSEKHAWSIPGIFGIFSFLSILSIECYQLFLHAGAPHCGFLQPVFAAIPLQNFSDAAKHQIALNSLSILWTFYGVLLVLSGLYFRSHLVRICGGIILFATFCKAGIFELLYRPEYTSVIFNPYFFSILCPSLAAVFFAVWLTYLKPLENQQERDCFKAFGVIGILFFWVVLSIECYTWFNRNPLSIIAQPEATRFIATASLSILWTLLAVTLITIGTSSRSVIIRCLGLLIFGGMILKIIVLELFQRPTFETPLLNPYFLPISFAAIAMIVAGVWTARFRPVNYFYEKIAFLTFALLGIALLWGAASIECYQYFEIRIDYPYHRFLGSSALTVFWTTIGVFLACIGLSSNSRPLRILGSGMLVLTLFKVLVFDLFARPDYRIPMLNPYAIPLVLLAFALIFTNVGLTNKLDEKDGYERPAYQVLIFTGILFLWAALSLECFRSVYL